MVCDRTYSQSQQRLIKFHHLKVNNEITECTTYEILHQELVLLGDAIEIGLVKCRT